MEINIETAIRVCPLRYDNEIICIQPNVYNNTVQFGNNQTYPVNYALPLDCSQNALFSTTVSPLINYFFEGCDVSVVTFGQSGTGKTYTLLGPGLHCALSESEYGIILRFLREIYTKISHHTERTFVVRIAWTAIFGEAIQDLLGSGSVECSSVSEAFELIQLGLSNITSRSVHTLFTITLEQHWVIETATQHRISTASFMDLAGCDKIMITHNNMVTQSIPTDSGLLSLQQCVWALSETPFNVGNIPYNQSVLTTLLRDSFGGRAKTVLICCVSPFLKDFSETYYTLQFALRTQMVKNFVTFNSYTTYDNGHDNIDYFGLQFAANQLFKLVVNAEDLFKSLVVTNTLTRSQIDQISQWLMLKQECEECLSETSEPRRSLEIIEEEEAESSRSESENTDLGEKEKEEDEFIDDDEENICERIKKLMEKFRLSTNLIVTNINTATQGERINSHAKENTIHSNNTLHMLGARRRRGSIHTSLDFPFLLSMSASHVEENCDLENSNSESDNFGLKDLCTSTEECEKETEKIDNNSQKKGKFIQDVFKSKNSKHKTKGKVEQLRKAKNITNTKIITPQTKNNQEKLKTAEKSKIFEIEENQPSSKKHVKKSKQKENCSKHSNQTDSVKKSGNLDDTNKELIASQDLCLTKYESLSSSCKSQSDYSTSGNLDNLRHEIRNLRRTRDYLVERLCNIDTKMNKRILSEEEERKLLQYEEAIGAIDFAIEYKNQIMCGCATLTSKPSSKYEEYAEKMMIERLLKLNENEMRSLLHHYFEKVVDLRFSSKKLEVQLNEMEAQNDSLTCRVQNLTQTLQQVRQQHEDKLHLMMRHFTNEDGNERKFSRLFERSKQAALALQVAQGSGKQIDKGIIARFTRYARQETVPRQLQVVNTQPQAKVTRQKNKLIIQQNNK